MTVKMRTIDMKNENMNFFNRKVDRLKDLWPLRAALSIGLCPSSLTVEAKNGRVKMTSRSSKLWLFGRIWHDPNRKLIIKKGNPHGDKPYLTSSFENMMEWQESKEHNKESLQLFFCFSEVLMLCPAQAYWERLYKL